MAAPTLHSQTPPIAWQRTSNRARRALVRPPIVHEQALCETPDVGRGTRIGAWAHVGGGAVVGCDCSIAASAEVDGILGDGVRIERGAFVAPGVRVGDYAVVRAGSWVRSDVPDHAVVAGDPAREIA